MNMIECYEQAGDAGRMAARAMDAFGVALTNFLDESIKSLREDEIAEYTVRVRRGQPPLDVIQSIKARRR